MKRMGWAAVATAGLLLAGCGAERFFRNRSDLVIEPQACVETRVPIYFAESEAGLTVPARDLIASTAEMMRGCDIRRVRVLGLASATGGAERNLSLSERRALTVAAALEEAGWPAPAFEVEAAGEAGAVSGGVAEPVRRRVELIIEARPSS